MARTKKSYGVDADGNAIRTQVKMVRNYMEETGKSVTQKFVTDKWGFTRLSAIIYTLKDDLEREGNKQVVADKFVTGVNRFGNATHYKEYWIESTTE